MNRNMFCINGEGWQMKYKRAMLSNRSEVCRTLVLVDLVSGSDYSFGESVVKYDIDHKLE